MNAGPRATAADPITRQLVAALDYAGLNPQVVSARKTPAQIAALTADGAFAAVVFIGFSLLSNAHRTAVPRVLPRLRDTGQNVPVIVYANVPPEEADDLLHHRVCYVAGPGLGLSSLTTHLRELLL